MSKTNRRGRKPNQDKLNTAQTAAPSELDSDTPPTYLRASGRTADWDRYLNTRNANHLKWLVPVQYFPHAALSNCWLDFAKVGTKIEIPNPFVKCNRPVYWVATIRMFAGYKALVEYESFGETFPHFAWISFCSSVPKPIGYCDENEILLFPPHKIHEKNPNFLEKMRARVSEYTKATVDKDHVDVVSRAILAQRRFRQMQTVEVLDVLISHVRRIGQVTGLIGDRVYVTYLGDPQENGFWVNGNSDNIHEIGFSYTIGCEVAGVPKTAIFPKLDPSYFPSYPECIKIKRGMVFETIHPLHVDQISTGKIDEVYKFGYFKALIQCNPPYDRILSFLFHITSPWLLPCGFSAKHGIDLVVPFGCNEYNFNWDSYCYQNELTRLDLSPLLPRSTNKFFIGAKMEAIDLRQPTYCGPVTVIKVVEHLLLLHFDGWKRGTPEAMQWSEWNSQNIYPVGWAEMMGHEFQSSPELPKAEDRPVMLVKMIDDENDPDLGEKESKSGSNSHIESNKTFEFDMEYGLSKASHQPPQIEQ